LLQSCQPEFKNSYPFSVILIGGINELQVAEQLLAEEKAELIGVAERSSTIQNGRRAQESV
jgi:2,4-dienoyl-CoA reductase-like NADH-dependent reductase (Old Yellow Enzyme family)